MELELSTLIINDKGQLCNLIPMMNGKFYTVVDVVPQQTLSGDWIYRKPR